MEHEVVNSEMLLPQNFSFKKVQMGDKYPKGHASSRHWKHLKQILQAENYQSYPTDKPNYKNKEGSLPSQRTPNTTSEKRRRGSSDSDGMNEGEEAATTQIPNNRFRANRNKNKEGSSPTQQTPNATFEQRKRRYSDSDRTNEGQEAATL